MLTALKTNCLVIMAGTVVFVNKLAMPLVLKYIGMATRCNLDWYLRRTKGKPKSILCSMADFISLVIISSPFRPKLNPCAVTGCIPTAASPINANHWVTNFFE